MVKKANNNKNKAAKAKNGPVRSMAKTKIPKRMANGHTATESKLANDWLRLLHDPCTAPLTRPCYTGMDAGYLIRTTDYYTPALGGQTGLTIGTLGSASFVFQYSPFNSSAGSGLVATAALSPDATTSAAGFGFTNFVTSTTGPVLRYRPVAACIKWIPSGTIANRSGVVDFAYVPNRIIAGGQTGISASAVRRMCQSGKTNGVGIHECKWLPTQTDETWTATSVADVGNVGTCVAVLTGVDTVAVSATEYQARGTFEITCIYEWTPTLGLGTTEAVNTPLPFTAQDVLSKIKNWGEFLYDMIPNFGNAAVYSAVASSAYLTSRMNQRLTQY